LVARFGANATAQEDLEVQSPFWQAALHGIHYHLSCIEITVAAVFSFAPPPDILSTVKFTCWLAFRSGGRRLK
jgi:hypothetical protein